MDTESAGAYFELINLNIPDAQTLIDLIASEGEEVSEDEFINGCVALRGPASQLNLAHVGKQLATTQRILLDVEEAVLCLRDAMSNGTHQGLHSTA